MGVKKRFAAKLLFQFRVVVGGESSKRRICEERIVAFEAEDAASALKIAKRKGRAAQFDSINAEGNRVRFEFVGVMDLLAYGAEFGPDEIWYEIKERVMPMERKDKFIPADETLVRNAERA